MNYLTNVKKGAGTLLFLMCILSARLQAQNINTIAGIGTSSFSGDGGLAISAELAQPVSVVRDASGNVYISDQGNHRIRKISASTGNISTVAGSSTAGFSGDGGSATSAELYYPSGIAVDGSGNIYIADQGNQRIRKVTASTGIITTIAGTGTAGFSGDGSAAASAKLNNPVGVALDGSGNIYISDQYNQRIRKITVSTGNISTIAGTGTYSYTGDGGAATSATFQNPAGLKVDASGNIFIADLFNHVVRKITASTGNISTIAGNGSSGFSGDGSAATSANLNYPVDVALDDSGNVFISVQYSHRIRKVSAVTGYISTIAGTGTAGYSGDGGIPTAAKINYPTGISADPEGNLYVADRENHRIRFICNYFVKPTITSPVNYCVGATASALSATGPSLKWFTTAVGGSGTSTAPTPSTSVAGTTKYYVASISSYGCEGPRDSITVVVNALPSAPTVSSPITYCVGATASALTATGTSLKWYTAASGGTALSGAPTPSTASAGSTTYYVSQTNTTTGCESPRATITVTVNALASSPTATTPINYCEGASASALTASGTSLLWYTTATGGTGATTAPTPTTTSTGTTVYYVSQTSACGESGRTAITVNVNAKPSAPTVSSPVTYCQYASASALTATGSSLKWYTVATGGTGSTTAITPSTASSGSTVYYVTQTNVSGCESDRASITVVVNAAPGTPTVTTPLNYCVGATASALSATGSSLLWYTSSTGGTGSSSAPTPSTTTSGTTTYYVSQTSGGCEGLRTAIVVNINALPSAPVVTSPLNLCEGGSSSALTASGTSLKWYTASTGGTALSGAPTPSTTATGTTVYYVSQTNASGCEGPRASISVVVNSVPSAPTVTSPVTYCQGAAASALTASGTSLKWYTASSGGSGSTTAPTPSTATAGSTNYYVSQTNAAGCEGPRASITVVVTASPSAPTVTSPVTYCAGATASALSATGTSLLWYTVSSGGTGSATAPTPSTTSAGSTTYYVSQTTSGCESPRASITVVVNPLPAAPTVTSPVDYCQGVTATALTATGTSLKWYTASSGGTALSGAPTPSTTATGTTTYYVSQTTTCGESSRSSIVVNVNPVPAAPTVVSPIEYCQGDTAVAFLSATGTNLKWYTTATGGTGSTTAPKPSTTTAGSTTYYVSQTNSYGCESPRASIVVKINVAPAAPIVTSPVIYCVGATASPLTATGTGLMWYTVPYGGTGSSTAPTPSTTTAGTTTYYVSQTDTSSCPSLRAAIVVNVYSLPSVPTVTTPVNYCEGASTSALSASASAGDTLKWYTVASGGTASLTAPTPSSATATTLTYYVSATSRYGCGESSRASVTVNINSKPAAPTVVSPVSYCAGATSSALSATGTSLKWYSAATGGTASTSTPVPSTSSTGTFTFYVSQTNAAGCEGPRASIDVTINAVPAAPTVTSPISYCLGASSAALTATGTSLLWYTAATGGTGSSTAPTPLTTSIGTTTYYVSQTGTGSCESSRAAIVVNVSSSTAAPTVTSPVNYCEGASASALTASGTSLLWYTAATGGTGSSTAPIPSTAAARTDTFYVSQTVTTGGCGESPRAAIVVNINSKPVAPTVSSTPVSYCAGASASVLTATGTTLKWYTVASGGTALSGAPTPSTASSGTTTYYVSQTNAASCEGPRASIDVTINALPSAPSVTATVSYCVGETAAALTASGTSLKWYTVASGGTALSGAPTPSTTGASTTTWYVSQTSSLSCEGPRASITATVNALPSAPTVTTPVTYCEGAIASALTASGTSLKWYTAASGGTGSSTAPTPLTTATGSTTYYVSQSSTAGCEGPRASIVVTINAVPAAPTVATTTFTYCQGEAASTLSATGTGLKWYTVATGGTGTSTAPTPSTASAGVTTYYVCQTSALGCEGPRVSITVTINATPSAPGVTSPVEYCSNTTAAALTATGTSLKWYTVATGGTASTSAPTPSTVSTGATTYYVSQSSAAGCESSRSAINVIVYATPSAPTVGFLVTLCLGGSSGALTATGSGLKWYTAATGGTGSSSAPTPSTATTGSTYYYVSQTSSSGCEGPRAAILVNIDTLLAAPTVVSPVVYCQGATASALSATGSSLRWYKDSRTGTYTSTAPVPNTSVADTIVYYVNRVSSAGCEGNQDSIIVYVNPLPAAPTVVTPVTYCEGVTASALTASGTSLKWYTVATGGTALSGAPTPSTTVSGSTTYYVSQSSAASCEGPRASITVNVNPAPSAPTVTTPVTYCQNETASVLTASGTSLKWYTVATGGTALSGAPTPSTTASGSTTYYVSQTSSASCEGPRASIVVTVNPLPAKPTVVSPVTYCIGETTTALTATGTSLKWYTAATGGTALSGAPTPSSATASTTTYFVSQTNSFSCEGPRDSIQVIINSVLPAPTVTSPVNYCVGETASALTATGSTLKWYTSATGGTALSGAPTPSTTASGTTTYYVSQTTTSGCEGTRASIVVNVNPLPAAPTVTTPVTYCQNETASVLTASGTSLKWYTVATGGTALSGAPTPSTTASGSTTYYVSQTSSASCEGPRASIVVTVNPLPAKPTVVSPVTYCIGETTTALTATGTSLKWYTAATGGTALSGAPTPSSATASTTTYFVSQTNSFSCEGPRDSIQVIINSVLPAPTVTSPVNYCVGETASALTATGSILKWYTAATGGTALSGAPTPSTTASGTTTYYVSQTTTSGCEGTRASIVVNVNPLPAAPTVTTPVTYCQNETASVLTASGTSLKWYTAATGGTALSGAPTPSTTASGTTTYYVSQTSSASCEGPRASIVVTVNPLPAKPTVVSPVTYCIGETTTALTATGTSLKWYTAATGGTALSGAPTPSSATASTTTYFVSQTNSFSCEGPRDSIQVIINSVLPAPTVTSPVNYCVGETAGALTATGSTLKWYTTATGGTALSGAPTPSTTASGTTTYYVSQTTTSGCEGTRASIVVTVNPLPSAPTVTSPVTYCQNETASVLTASGTSLKWYTAATGGTALSGAPTPSTTASGSTTYYVSQTSSSSCEGPRASIVVTVNPLPAKPTVVSPVTYCIGETTTALTATGTSLKWYTAATGGTALSGAPTPSSATASTTTYFVSQTNSFSCEGPRDSIQVIINSVLPAPTVTSPVNYCVGETASALTATGSTLKWYTSATGGTALSGAPTPSTTASGTTTYYVSQTTTSGCEGTRASIVVNVNPLPAAPTVTTPVTHCQNETASVLTASGTSLKWYTAATGGTALSGAPTPSTTASGSTTYYVSQTSSASCEGPRASIVVTVNPLPAKPTVTSPVTYCVGASATALTATGTSLKWYTTASGGTALSGAPTPSTASAGSTTYFVSQTSALSCEGPRDSIVVTINPLPSAPTVSTPVNYCEGGAATALTATGTSLLWYTSASGGTGTTTAPTPSTATTGSTTYYVSQSSALSCEGPRASIVVTVNPLPAAPTVTTPVTYCQNETASTLTASGTSLKWYTVATGGTALSGAPTPSTTASGSTTYYVSQTSSASCEGPRASIVVTVNPLPAKPTVISPVTYCVGASATALTATGTSLKWYTTATGGTALSTAPTPSTASAGSTTYFVSQTSALSCEGPRDSIVVTINPLPSAPTVSTPVNYCEGSISTALTATGSGLLWYTSASGGTGTATAPTPSTAATGSTTYYVSQTSGLSCEGPRASILVTVNPLPAAPTVTSPVTYCEAETASALTATGTSLKWYTVATGGTALSGAPTPSTTASGSTTYYVSQTSSASCEGPRASIVVTVNPLPAAPTVTTPLTYCEAAVASPLTATGTSLKWYTTATGGTGSATAPTPSTATAGSTTYYVSQTSTLSCEGPRASIVVTINPLPSAPTVTTPVKYCEAATASALTATGTSLKWYTAATGGTGLATAPTPSTASAGSTTYYVSQTSSASCEGPRAAIVVTINPLPAAPTVTTPVAYCEAATATALTATGTSLKWYTTATGGTGSTTAPTPSTATAGSTTYYVSQTSAASCEGPRAAIVVNINPLPAAPTVSTPVKYCQNETATALTATGTTLKWYTASSGGTASTSAPTPVTTTAGSTIYYVSQSTTFGCEGPRAAITVTVNPTPAAPIVKTPIGYCQGSTAVPLTATGTALMWYTVATGGTGTSIAPTPSTAVIGLTDYYVSQTSTEGCESPRAKLTVDVTGKPDIKIVPVGSPMFVYCKKDSVVLKAVSSVTLTAYQWYRDGIILPGETSDLYKAYMNGTYKVSVKNIYGCEKDTSVYVFGDTLPDPVLSPIELQFCPNVNIVLFCKPASPSYKYEWFKDSVYTASSTTDKLIINKAGTYYIRVTDSFACVTYTNKSVATTYPAAPKPSIIRLDPILKLSRVFFTYQWWRNGKLIVGANAISYAMPYGGKYWCEVTDANGCTTTSDTVDTDANPNAIRNSQISSHQLKIYPNPTQSKVWIETDLKIDVRVTDVTGRLILMQKDAAEIDLNSFADAVYIFTILNKEGEIIGVEKIDKISGIR